MNEDYKNYLYKTLAELLSIPSPSGYTDQVVRYVCEKLTDLGVEFELTRRGAIRGNLYGKAKSPDRAVVAHLDTLGVMVKSLKDNGRLEVVPIGTWSSRFAEGCRVTIFTEDGPKRGTILPIKASGHTYNLEIDQLPVAWETVELRVDEKCESIEDLKGTGFNVGDFVAIDSNLEITKSGFINARHLDNKAGVATLLTAVKMLKDQKQELPIDCHLLFTISEEVGSGASAVLHQDVAEMLSIDNSTVAPGQNSHKYGITVAIKDSSGPFDYHLTQKIIKLCKENEIPFSRDVFRWYRCDAASAIEAGNDIRTALVCFACDSSHGYERTHIESLESLCVLLREYIKSTPTVKRDQHELGALTGFPKQPIIQEPELVPEKTVRSNRYDEE